jgi:predicted nucleotidyltransferase
VQDLDERLFGIAERVLDEAEIRAGVNKLVAAARGPVKVILFGSYARGEAQPQSDINLFVIEDGFTSANEQYQEAARLRRALDFPVSVDVDILVIDSVEWNEWKNEFGSVYYDAATEGKVLHG